MVIFVVVFFQVVGTYHNPNCDCSSYCSNSNIDTLKKKKTLNSNQKRKTTYWWFFRFYFISLHNINPIKISSQMYFHQIFLIGFSDKILTCNILYIYCNAISSLFTRTKLSVYCETHWKYRKKLYPTYFYIFTQILKNQKRENV